MGAKWDKVKETAKRNVNPGRNFGKVNPDAFPTAKKVGKAIKTPETYKKNIIPGRNFGQTQSSYTPTLKKAGSAAAQGTKIFFGGDSKGGSPWWIFFAILLYISDIFLTRFNGFRIRVFLDAFLKLDFELMVRILLNAGIIAIMIAYAIWKKPDKREFFSFFLLAELFWLIVTFGGGTNMGSLLHLIFVVCIWLWLISPNFEDKTESNLLAAICLFVDFFLFSLISEIAPNLSFFNRLIIPIWVFVALALTKESQFKKIATFLIIMFYVFNAFAVVNEWQEFYDAGSDTLTSNDIIGAKTYAKESWDNMINFGKSFGRQKLNETLGEYYQGEIDQNAQRVLGVYLKDVQAADTKFYEDQPIIIWGTLTAQTIEEMINVKINCKVDDQNITGVDIFPQTEFSVESYEEASIECTFEPGLIDEGNHEISLNAEFNFLTSGYIKTYFMDQETKRSFTREGIDPLDSYGIVEKNPIAKYTSGPIQMGITVGRPPLSAEDDFRMGITLTNTWLGKLKEVTDMYIVMPKEVEMIGTDDFASCTGKRHYIFKKSDCQEIEEAEEGCDDDIHNVYRIELGNTTMKDIEVFETFLCRLKVSDSSRLLGDLPITTKYFKVATKYDYNIFEKIGIDVKGGDNVRTVLDEGDCKTTCTDPDGCLCPHGCEVAKGDTAPKDSNCGGGKRDNIKANLTSCILICTDPDGCTCPSNCVITTDISDTQTCGGERTSEQSTDTSDDSTTDTSSSYTTAPNIISFEINGGNTETNIIGIVLNLNVKDAQECGYARSGTEPIGNWQTVSDETLSIATALIDEREGDEHIIWVQCRNSVDNSNVLSDSIIYNPSS
jgi:hypothetical protein